jgi:hypothetical protein
MNTILFAMRPGFDGGIAVLLFLYFAILSYSVITGRKKYHRDK